MSLPSMQLIVGYAMIYLLCQLFVSIFLVFVFEQHLWTRMQQRRTQPRRRWKWFLRMAGLPSIFVIFVLFLPSSKLIGGNGRHNHGSGVGSDTGPDAGSDSGGAPGQDKQGNTNGPESEGGEDDIPHDVIKSGAIKPPLISSAPKDSHPKPIEAAKKPPEKAVVTGADAEKARVEQVKAEKEKAEQAKAAAEAEKLKAAGAEKAKAAAEAKPVAEAEKAKAAVAAEKPKAADAEKAKTTEAEKAKTAEAEKAKKDLTKAGESAAKDPHNNSVSKEKPKEPNAGGAKTVPDLTSTNARKDPAKEPAAPESGKHSRDVPPDTNPLDEQTRHALAGIPGTPLEKEPKKLDLNPRPTAVKSVLADGNIPPMVHTGNTAALWRKYPRVEGAWVLDRAEEAAGSGKPATIAKWVYEPKHDDAYSSTDSMFQALTGSYQLEELIPVAKPEKLAIWRHHDRILRESGISGAQGDRIRWGWFRHRSEAILLAPVVDVWNRAIHNGEIRPDPNMDNILEVFWAAKPDGTPFAESARFLPDGKRNSPQARVLTLAN